MVAKVCMQTAGDAPSAAEYERRIAGLEGKPPLVVHARTVRARPDSLNGKTEVLFGRLWPPPAAP